MFSKKKRGQVDYVLYVYLNRYFFCQNATFKKNMYFYDLILPSLNLLTWGRTEANIKRITEESRDRIYILWPASFFQIT